MRAVCVLLDVLYDRSLLGRSFVNLWRAICDDGDEDDSTSPLFSFCFYSLLEALPSVLALGALAPHVRRQTFNCFGTIPWALKVYTS